MSKSLPYSSYVSLLKRELIPALGCTEPISLAYAAAWARKVIGRLPDGFTLECSPGIIKNTKGVIIPFSGGLKGMVAAISLGLVGGNACRGLNVLDSITSENKEAAINYMAHVRSDISQAESTDSLYICLTVYSGNDKATVVIKGHHTGIVRLTHNGLNLPLPAEDCESGDDNCPIDSMTVDEIVRFADTVPLPLIIDIFEQQVAYNMRIAEEGLSGDYGLNIGRNILSGESSLDIRTMVKAYAAAGSDARMGGCPMPVIINSGSGNQGLTVSLPVIVYAKDLNVSREKLIRALACGNLIALHLRLPMGGLSAFCGVVCAACGAGAGITYLRGGDARKISMTITNTLASITGMICDGAKASCALKIATAVDSALIGHELAMQGKTFDDGDGIVGTDVEETIKNVIRIAVEGMACTNQEILGIMNS
ncbi:L-cysteine desulfidase family protein [Parasphaerochaeta coccoides]|nr:L-serine ammonia-lyase, iron-sulfur-dependent, subunit alpha [Parasphaerochaeta coccoides]